MFKVGSICKQTTQSRPRPKAKTNKIPGAKVTELAKATQESTIKRRSTNNFEGTK